MNIEYEEQLTRVCCNVKCMKVFCRKVKNPNTRSKINNILCRYGDIFYCRNTTKLLVSQNKLEYKGNWVIDMVLRYINDHRNYNKDSIELNEHINMTCSYISKNVYRKNSITKQTVNATERVASNADKFKNNTQNTNRNKESTNTHDRDCANKENMIDDHTDVIPEDTIQHHYCKYINKTDFTEEETYLLSGALYLLLNLFNKQPNNKLGLAILRSHVFVVTSLCEDIHFCFLMHKVLCLVQKCNKKKCCTKLYNKCLCNEMTRSNINVPANICELACSTNQYGNIHHMGKRSSSNLDNNSLVHDYNIKQDDSKLDICDGIDITCDNKNINNTKITPLPNTNRNSTESTGETTDESIHINEHIGMCTFGNKCSTILSEERASHICLGNPILDKSDLQVIINKYIDIVNKTRNLNIRENRKLESVLSLLYLLYVINIKYQAVQNKTFYIERLCDTINLKEEFRFYRSKNKTILNYSFVLPLHLKAELLKYENSDLMKASLQDAFFKSLFEGHVEPYLFITVTRDKVYEDSIRILHKLKTRDVHKQLRITFKNEEGIDSGGIRKEFFQLLSQEIKNDTELFSKRKGFVWLKDDDNILDKCYCIGKLLGVALYNNVVLDIPFPSFFFKMLLNKKLSFADLKEFDSELYGSLCKLKKLAPEDLDSLELTWAVPYKTGTNKVMDINLLENKKLKKKILNLTKVSSINMCDIPSQTNIKHHHMPQPRHKNAEHLDKNKHCEHNSKHLQSTVVDKCTTAHKYKNDDKRNNAHIRNQGCMHKHTNDFVSKHAGDCNNSQKEQAHPNETRVSKDTLKLFIHAYSTFVLRQSVQKQLDAIKEGFYAVINKNILSHLDPKELEKILMGSNDFDIASIKSTTSYNGYKQDDKIIEYFWEIFESYSKKMKKKLIQFITGNDRIPVSGSASLRLIIMKNGCDTNRLPSSQTCFNTLLLPEYSSKHKLACKLNTALELTAGFFLM